MNQHITTQDTLHGEPLEFQVTPVEDQYTHPFRIIEPETDNDDVTLNKDLFLYLQRGMATMVVTFEHLARKFPMVADQMRAHSAAAQHLSERMNGNSPQS